MPNSGAEEQRGKRSDKDCVIYHYKTCLSCKQAQKKVHIQFYAAALLHTKITLTLGTKTKEKTKPEV